MTPDTMATMYGPRQFSLGYLFLEIFWIALSLGLATQAIRLPPSPDADLYRAMLILPAIVFAGAAVGGLFGRMTAGFCVVYGFLALGLAATIAGACFFIILSIFIG